MLNINNHNIINTNTTQKFYISIWISTCFKGGVLIYIYKIFESSNINDIMVVDHLNIMLKIRNVSNLYIYIIID